MEEVVGSSPIGSTIENMNKHTKAKEIKTLHAKMHDLASMTRGIEKSIAIYSGSLSEYQVKFYQEELSFLRGLLVASGVAAPSALALLTLGEGYEVAPHILLIGFVILLISLINFIIAIAKIHRRLQLSVFILGARRVLGFEVLDALVSEKSIKEVCESEDLEKINSWIKSVKQLIDQLSKKLTHLEAEDFASPFINTPRYHFFLIGNFILGILFVAFSVLWPKLSTLI